MKLSALHKQRFVLVILFVAVSYCCKEPTQQNYILFYTTKPESYETNFYNNNKGVKFNYDIQCKNLKNANVVDDVKRAIKNKDLRVVAIAGLGIIYPGLEDSAGLEKKYEAHLQRYGSKVIAGTSDALGVNKPNIQIVAYDYAKEYNQLLLKLISVKSN
jgi:hypothetical protein